MNYKYLGIGIAIGLALGLAIAIAVSMQQRVPLTGIRDNSITCEKEECLDFYIWGIIKEISANSLTLVQVNETATANSSSSVTIAPFSGAALLWCTGDGPSCDRTTYDKIPTGTLACAHARLNPDGSFDINRIFFNTACFSG